MRISSIAVRVVIPAKTAMLDAEAREAERLCLDCRAVKPKKPLNIENKFSSADRAYFHRHFYSSMTRVSRTATGKLNSLIPT